MKGRDKKDETELRRREREGRKTEKRGKGRVLID